MVTTSRTGFTVTDTVVLPVRPEIELVAVTENESTLAGDPGGMVGAVNDCCEPLLPEGVNVMPAGACHV
jgi:hypothetical protein